MATTNGPRTTSRQEMEGPASTVWTSHRPIWDMALVASPHLKKLDVTLGGADTEEAEARLGIEGRALFREELDRRPVVGAGLGDAR